MHVKHYFLKQFYFQLTTSTRVNVLLLQLQIFECLFDHFSDDRTGDLFCSTFSGKKKYVSAFCRWILLLIAKYDRKTCSLRKTSRMRTVCYSGCLEGRGRVSAEEVSARGVSGWEGVSAQGSVCLGGVCLGGSTKRGMGGCLGMSVRLGVCPGGVHPPPWTDRHLWKHYLSATVIILWTHPLQ